MENRNNDIQALRVAIDLNTIKSEFASTVQIETAPDHVIFNFIQTIPGASENQPNAKVISRVAVTWPHFAQIHKIMRNLMEDNKSMVNDFFVKTVLHEEDTLNGK